MERGSLDDLRALIAVGRERSFTKAAAKLGVSQSALSQTIRQLEARLGVRLLTRTTRSVSPTEAGERLLRTVEPRFQEIDAEMATIAELREKPSGTIRITATEHAIGSVLVPKLTKLLREYPDIKVEMSADYRLTAALLAAAETHAARHGGDVPPLARLLKLDHRVNAHIQP